MSILTRARAGIIAAIVTFAVLAGTGVGYAYWSATAQATLGVGAATLTSTATGWNASTLGNENIASTGSISLVSTGSITITNTTSTTSTQTETLNATFSRASGSAALATATAVTVWSVASAASCTNAAVPSSPVTGNWNTGVTASAPLAPGSSIVYCIRNTITDRQGGADPSGVATFTPQVAALIAVGTNFSGGSTVTSTLSTRYLFPLQNIGIGIWNYVVRATTTWCFDVSGSGTTDGSLLISYACKNNTDLNQDFRFMDSDGDGYGEFVPRHATNLRVAAAASTTSGSAVDMRTASGSAQQQWQPQLVSANTYQFVNKYSGLCLSLPSTSTGVTTQVTCNGGGDQKFTLTFRSAVQFIDFDCSNIGGNANNRSVQFDWDADYSVSTLTWEAKLSSAGTWTPLGTSTGGTIGSFAFASPVGAPFTGNTGTYNVRVLNSSGQVLGTANITVSNSFFGIGYNYARCS